MTQTTPDDRTQNILALTRGILRELEDTQEPTAAVNYCREIYRVAIQAIPGEELIRAMESRMPKPRTAPADDISLSTNGRKLVIARPIGELGGYIIYVTTAPGPVGVYFGAVRFSRRTTSGDLIPEWDVDYPETRRKSLAAQEQELTPKPKRPELFEKGDCMTCAHRTQTPDESGKFRCKINRPSTAEGRGKCADCAEVPAHRCAYKQATPLTIRKRMTGEHWHKAVVAAANRGVALPEEYYPYIAWVDAHKGPALAREQAYHFAAMDRDGISYHEVLTTQSPKDTAAKMYPDSEAIKRCIVSAAIVGIQNWNEKQQNKREQTNAPIGNNHEGQTACP